LQRSWTVDDDRKGGNHEKVMRAEVPLLSLRVEGEQSSATMKTRKAPKAHS
jgi:hypothetical protein